jgi:hypothetical protein
MIASYPFDSTVLDRNPTGLGSQNTQKNLAFSFTVGDMQFQVAPGQPSAAEMPAKVLRGGGVAGSGLIPTNTGLGPHQDYTFLKSSSEYSYTTRVVAAGGVIEKIMSAGAQVGDEGRMILYKGCTLAQVEVGGWTSRLIRPFIITAADLTNRETGWPLTGAVPTVDVAAKAIVDNGGDGYNHV